eukprot:CAMPEP_0172514024 /NCGR_PEP_ID=MMETSP1066-20121228/257245_1 /TAXON_ID=671091 /ORGANISM="Coscinodiscus wailesii, Strain CCMP2513" /LENGTH=1453 /DNA_ID=CAMNT_0013294535 /DNA_START=42 /DNA_END=4403 /DNA_ORIENTATION=-
MTTGGSSPPPPPSSSSPVPGEILLTHYGVVVVTKVIAKDDDGDSDMFRGRIWRTPGKSIASSSICFVRNDAILERLPAAPGMVTKADLTTASCLLNDGSKQDPLSGDHDVMVYNYCPSSKTYTVSPHSNEVHNLRDSVAGTIVSDHAEISTEKAESASSNDKQPPLYQVASVAVQPAKSAKFYALVEELMERGDAAANASSSFLNSSTINKLASKSTETLTKMADSTSQSLSKDNVSSVSTAIEKGVQTILPDQEQISEVIKMMKDEELTSLLEKGRTRLRQLIVDDIPKATQTALGESGITIKTNPAGSSSTSSDSTSLTSILASREQALQSLDTLLSQNDVNISLEEIQTQLGSQFTTVFDSLSTAAQSDRYLNSLFDKLSEKTSQWQEMTGCVLSTKSASLFFEGTQRLQARAATIFSPSQILKAKEAGMRLTKSFTEGDAAVARIKSLELGDALRSRLIAAIELRSGSHGGLDAIIADALTSVSPENLTSKASDVVSEENVQMVLSQLQTSATRSAQNAHETLIATLSAKSQYREMAMLRIENTLVQLEGQLEGDMSADEIAAIARGDGGTAALFEPIARKAAKEINKQLDLAEGKISDPTYLGILQQVRKIVSGEMSVSGLMDEVVNVLNDEAVVSYGEDLVNQGERVLDVLENASGNKTVEDVLAIAEKAGLTKDAVIGAIDNLDINKVMDTAETAISDEAARKKMLSGAADAALDFLLRILPSMPVPPFDGVREGLVYHLSNLSMEGFKVRKENIIVEIAGIRAKKDKDKKDSSGGDLSSSGDVSNGDSSGLKERKHSNMSLSESSVDSGFYSAGETTADLTKSSSIVKPTELLIIDVRRISAIFKDPVWSFEQTYFPYLKGDGTAFVELFDGSIRLQFELRKRRVKTEENEGDEKWEPILCLHEHTCQIGELTLKLNGEGRITWIFNKLSTYFKAPLRNYVVKSIINVLGNRSGALLKMLNDNLKSYWEIILRTAGLTMEDLAEISESDLVEAPPEIDANEVELVWREHLPLGMNLLMNDDSGLLKVVDFPRGSQARKVCEGRQLDPDVFKGATLTAVNGTHYDLDTQDELIAALKDPGRPKTVGFQLSNPEDAERIRRFVSGLEKDDDALARPPEIPLKALEHKVKTVVITKPGSLGIEFATSLNNMSLIVEGYTKSDTNETLLAEANPDISIGDILVSVNGKMALGDSSDTGAHNAISLLEAAASVRPLTLGFTSPYTHYVVYQKHDQGVIEASDPTEELILQEDKSEAGNRIKLKDFERVAGLAETGKVFIGDYLVFVNGVPVGAGCQFFEKGPQHNLCDVEKMFQDEVMYPIALTFARPRVQNRWSKFSMETATTFGISANHFEELGCTFGRGQGPMDIVVTEFNTVKGPFQSSLDKSIKWPGMSLETINGQIVPSYATSKMVKSVLRRSWVQEGRVEITFCDDERREWLMGLMKEGDGKE